MNIVTNALPEELQKLIRSEKAKGELKTYDEFMTFVTTLTASSQYKKHDPPKPIAPSRAIKLVEQYGLQRGIALDVIVNNEMGQPWDFYSAK